MIGYASRTGTISTLNAMKARGWRTLLSAKGRLNPLRAHDLQYALENGAWWAHLNNVPFDVEAYEKALALFGGDADWIAIPDIVMGGDRSMILSRAWHADLIQRRELAGRRLLFVVQDGMQPADLGDLISRRVGIFIGGSTEWKLATIAQWCSFAHERSAWSHVGRVNSTARISLCAAAGASSFDGTSVTQFPITLARLDGARRQPDLFAPRPTA